jgi:asparaginyl-tRNA synthetase
MTRIKIKELLKSTAYGSEVTVKGWVRTKRENKAVAFIALNDGSIITNIQIVVDVPSFNEDTIKLVTTGACIAVIGTLIQSQGKGQTVEIQAKNITILGVSDPEKYPLQPKEHSLEFLREIAHLRMRTNTFSAVMRMRHAMAFAVHKFFNDRGFVYLHTPIITGSDAGGLAKCSA